MGVHYKQDVDSHRVTLDCIMKDGLKKGVCYKQVMHVLLREYGILLKFWIAEAALHVVLQHYFHAKKANSGLFPRFQILAHSADLIVILITMKSVLCAKILKLWSGDKLVKLCKFFLSWTVVTIFLCLAIHSLFILLHSIFCVTSLFVCCIPAVSTLYCLNLWLQPKSRASIKSWNLLCWSHIAYHNQTCLDRSPLDKINNCICSEILSTWRLLVEAKSGICVQILWKIHSLVWFYFPTLLLHFALLL